VKSINFIITARFTTKTLKLNVKIYYESAEVPGTSCCLIEVPVSYFGTEPTITLNSIPNSNLDRKKRQNGD